MYTRVLWNVYVHTKVRSQSRLNIRQAKHKPVEYEWATRHTVESWRERYKKFAPAFDKRISKLAKAEPRIKPAWPEDRRMTHERLRRVIELDSDSEEEEEGQAPGSGDEEEYVPASPPKRRRSDRLDLPSAKRARISSPPRRPSRRQRPSATRNGKGKAVEEEEEELDAEDQYEGTYVERFQVLCVILNRHDAGLYLVAAISRRICLELFRRQSIPSQTMGTFRLNTRPKTPWLQRHRMMAHPRLRPHLEINHATRISFPNQQVSAPCRPFPLDPYQTPNLINTLGVRFM